MNFRDRMIYENGKEVPSMECNKPKMQNEIPLLSLHDSTLVMADAMANVADVFWNKLRGKYKSRDIAAFVQIVYGIIMNEQANVIMEGDFIGEE